MDEREFQAKYIELAYAVQSGVDTMMNYEAEAAPKHLRVGINMAMIEHGALAKLLIDKGIIKSEDYNQALIEGLEKEVVRYEKDIQEVLGAKIHLR